MDVNSVESKTHIIRSSNRTSLQSVPRTDASPPKKNEIESDSISLTKNARKQAKESLKTEGSSKFQRKLSVAGNKQVVMKLIDPETKDVVRQIPPEDLLRLQEAIRNAAENLDI